jgi:osmotically-inducible protein OsmY
MTYALPVNDHEIKTAIDRALANAADVEADDIGVGVHRGAITLSGEVDSELQKAAAVGAAQRVAGVIGVADEIVVRQAEGVPHDADIACSASDALTHARLVPAGSVKVTVHDHTVTLTGTVHWEFEREAARRAVAGLPGVSWISNRVDVRPPEELTPAILKTLITEALVQQAEQVAGRISVAVRGQRATLTGTVASHAERREVERAARAAAGVTDVVNELRVHDGESSTDAQP